MFLLIFRERRRKGAGERGKKRKKNINVREKHRLVASHASWPGIEPAAFWCPGWCSPQRSRPARGQGASCFTIAKHWKQPKWFPVLGHFLSLGFEVFHDFLLFSRSIVSLHSYCLNAHSSKQGKNSTELSPTGCGGTERGYVGDSAHHAAAQGMREWEQDSGAGGREWITPGRFERHPQNT